VSRIEENNAETVLTQGQASGQATTTLRVADEDVTDTLAPTRKPTLEPTVAPVQQVKTLVPTFGMTESFSPTPLVSASPTIYIGPTLDVEIWITIGQHPEEVVWKILDFTGRNLIDRMTPGFYDTEGGWISTISLKPSSIYTFVLTESKGRSNARYSILSVDDKMDVIEYLADDQTDRSTDPPKERNFHRMSTFAL